MCVVKIAFVFLLSSPCDYLLTCSLSPHKVLWIFPYEWLRWLSIGVALCLSGSVLIITFWPAVRDDKPRVIAAVMSAIVVLNVLLAVGCKVNAPDFLIRSHRRNN